MHFQGDCHCHFARISTTNIWYFRVCFASVFYTSISRQISSTLYSAKMSLGDEITEEDWFIPPKKYEYLDHTADVQLHAWGSTLQEAFEQCANAMFGYITDIEYVEMKHTLDIDADGDDLQSLLYHFLDEFLYNFCAEPNFIPKKVQILNFDIDNFKIKARGFGEIFEIGKHPQGADVKAITYSNMQIHQRSDKCEVFVIIDI